MNTEKKVTTAHVYNQKFSAVSKYIQVIKANNHHQITIDNNNDLIVSVTNNFLVILLNQNFSSITNVE